MKYEIRELKVGGILDQAIKLIKENFWLVLKIAAVILIPYSIIAGLLIAWNMPDMTKYSQPAMYGAGAQTQIELPVGYFIIIGVVALIGGLIIHPITDAAMIYTFGNSYLEKPISVGIALRRALGKYLPLLGTWILFWLALCLPIAIGAIAGIVLGPAGFILMLPLGIMSLVFAFWFMLAPQVVVIEGIAGPAALARSKKLMKGNVGTAFVLGIIVGIISWLIGLVAAAIPQMEMQTVFSAIIQALLTIFSYAAWVVFYFSARCKAENFDLTMLADAVATDDPPAVKW
jgi:hypothetical protein